ncbi:MAG: N-acetylmuramoyl-L-alanine amidase family protein [bacterium]
MRQSRSSSVRPEPVQDRDISETPAYTIPASPSLKPATEPIFSPVPAHPAGNIQRSNDPELQMIKEGERTFGVYRLKAGEALYSAVVVRFTGRVDAEDVNQIARQLVALNNISDETQIPTGAAIRIPLEVLDETLFTELATAPRQVFRRSYFKHVILDAGHGGTDPGTIVRGLREDEIAFDLMKRIREGLVKHGIKVHTLVSAYNGASKTANGHVSREGKRHQYVKVTPAYNMQDSRIGLNLRIYLIEDIYSRLLHEGVAPEEVLFLSIHLDHLHPSVSGTMIYVPDAAERIATFKTTGEVYDKFAESRGQLISFGAEQYQSAENASTSFARTMIASLQRAGMPIHTFQPIRSYVYRSGGKWTPGIIRYSRVPASILIEAANLAHRSDWQRIRAVNFRQRWAGAVVRAVIASH